MQRQVRPLRDARRRLRWVAEDLDTLCAVAMRAAVRAGPDLFDPASSHPAEGAAVLDAEAQVDQERYISHKFDCDDFAHLLKSAFIRDAYTNGYRRHPYSLGVVWGKDPAHAMNLIVTSNGSRRSFRLIEPQSGNFYKPSDEKLKDIYLVII